MLTNTGGTTLAGVMKDDATPPREALPGQSAGRGFALEDRGGNV